MRSGSTGSGAHLWASGCRSWHRARVVGEDPLGALVRAVYGHAQGIKRKMLDRFGHGRALPKLMDKEGVPWCHGMARSRMIQGCN